MQNDPSHLPDRPDRHVSRGSNELGSVDEESETANTCPADQNDIGRETASPALTHQDIPTNNHRCSPRKLPRSPTDRSSVGRGHFLDRRGGKRLTISLNNQVRSPRKGCDPLPLKSQPCRVGFFLEQYP